jgi:16S rRNA (uracil1498-N3)-methyltransferase
MSRFYVSKESVKENQVLISGKEAHHILDVMRLKVSDEIVVFDGTGKEYVGKVKEVGHKTLSLEIVKTRDAIIHERYNVTLIQAIPKKDKMDYIVEKATELGVDRVIPVITTRTIPDWNESKKVGIVERWERIAQETAKQCGRTVLPEIKPIMDFKNAIIAASSVHTSEVRMIAALSDKTIKLKNVLKSYGSGKIVIAIGPEGDFTKEEIEFANKSGFKTVSLGSRVLKSDTAALALLAMINYEYQE